MRSLPILVLLFMTLALPASASDGVLEINQTCAVETGCFAGDTAGFPVTISASGSYVLTSNLTSAGADTDGLFLSTSRVTIDFNGFSLTGPSLGSGTGNGVAGAGTVGSFAGFTTLKNGVIRGFRAKGVELGGAKGVRIEDMTLQFNAGGGASVGDEARILRNGFSDNGGTSTQNRGLTAGVGAMIVENVVRGSGGSGIQASGGSTVSGNTAYQNGSDGIVAGNGSTVSGNTASRNGGRGIAASSGSTVSGNTAFNNDGDGIATGSSVTVLGNTVGSNAGFGLILSSESGYRENVISSNTAGTVATFGTIVNLGNNACNGSTTCP